MPSGKIVIVFAVWFSLICAAVKGCQLKVGAFKVEVLGKAKMDKPDVVDVLKKTIALYDIILIQDIRDASQTAIYELLDNVNNLQVGVWGLALSPRLGRTSSKAQYAFFYNKGNVDVINQYVWNDTASDVFEREPFAVRFRTTPSYGVGEFGFIGIQVKPSDAVSEIDKLTDVYDDIAAKWNLTDIIIGGNFDAGCSYVKTSDWPNIRLRQQSRFFWVIDDTVDTTTSTTTFCAYDRLVLAGSHLVSSYLANSSSVFRFDSYFNLNQDLTDKTSDHYPVQLRFI